MKQLLDEIKARSENELKYQEGPIYDFCGFVCQDNLRLISALEKCILQRDEWATAYDAETQSQNDHIIFNEDAELSAILSGEVSE